MNLINVMLAGAIGLIIATSISQLMITQAKMASHIEYLNDTQTARNSLELRTDCKKLNLATCQVRDQTNNVILDSTGWTVGRAFVQPICDSEGANVFVRQVKGTRWKALIPLKVCGNGAKVCNMIANADGVSCTGGSK